MAIVTIPFNYDPSRDVRIIPICIQDTDCEDRQIDRRWLNAVVPIADPLRNLSKRVLHDVWRVSEVTETSVHALWRKHQFNLGRNPSAQIFAHAKWTAKDLAAGGRNNRRGVNVTLIEALRDKLHATCDVYRQVSTDELRALIRQEFRERGMTQTDEILEMFLHGNQWKEIAQAVGGNHKTVTRQFWRRFNRALENLKLR